MCVFDSDNLKFQEVAAGSPVRLKSKLGKCDGQATRT